MEQIAEEAKMSPEQLKAAIEKEEDEYFDQMLAAFQSQENNTNIDDDIEFFTNHPLFCKKLTPEQLETPEMQAL